MAKSVSNGQVIQSYYPESKPENESSDLPINANYSSKETVSIIK